MLRGVALVVAALLLPACAGLPMAGDVAAGLPLGESPQDVDILPVASGPISGAGPQKIVEGFLEAGITTADNWETARKFLAEPLQQTWRPSAGVSIDVATDSRTITASVPDDDVEDVNSAEVQVLLDLVASVDEFGEYSEAVGASPVRFALERQEDGEWRITEAPDGIVIDDPRFTKVFDGYPLQYFDASWSRLVPDMRWFPRRLSPATTVTKALISGAPSAWLDPAVQNAFPADVQLAQEAVPITSAQVAEVALTRSASGLDGRTLSRMRTQLQATLRAAGVSVSEVRFTVDDRALDAGVVDVAEPAAEAGTLVVKDGAFGRIVGGEISPISGISDQIADIAEPLAAIEVAADDSRAAVQLADGRVFLLRETGRDELDAGPGMIAPSLDRYGYVWTVPGTDPTALRVWGDDVAPLPVKNAWPSASSISDLRVAADGARIAAVIMVGGQRWLVVAAVVRDSDGVPTALDEIKQLRLLDGASIGLSWLGPDRLGVLVDPTNPRIVTQIVSGPGLVEAAPGEAVSFAGARTPAGARVLGSGGQLFAHAGSAWREVATGVTLLATRAGE